MKGDGADGNRAMATGIIWIRDAIAINALRLSKFTSKSKSSINGGFHALGYGTIPLGEDVSAQVNAVLHLTRKQFPLRRHWTIRRLISDSTEPLTDIVRCCLKTRKPPFDLPFETWGLEEELDYPDDE
jgi:hypothetical protein